MQTLIALSLAAALSPDAAASSRHAFLEIDNRFDGKAAVFLDGRFLTQVEGDSRIRLDVSPGPHRVEVRRPDSGYVLFSERLGVSRGSTVSVRVIPPKTSLRLVNAGEVALRLQTPDHSVWLKPDSAITVRVDAGFVPLTAFIQDPRGESEIIERRMWVEPGRMASETLRPDPAIVRIVNRDDKAVRIKVDGRDAGWLRPGETECLFLRPGDSMIALVESNGHIRLSQRLHLSRGEDVSLVLDDRRDMRRKSRPVGIQLDATIRL